MLTAGSIYVLVNPSIPGLVKVGKTSRDVEDRIKELSSATGVPSEFLLIYEQYFSNVDKAELIIHTILENKGFRHASNREFFTMDPSEIIKIVNKTHEELNNSDKNEYSNNKNVENNYQWYEIWKEAESYHMGLDDYLMDDSEALDLYLKAGKLGCPFVYKRIAGIYLEKYGLNNENRENILNLYKSGIKAGDYYCFLKMGYIYHLNNNIENVNKCFNKFIESYQKKDYLIESNSNVYDYLNEFLKYVYKDLNIDSIQKVFISEMKYGIIEEINKSIERMKSYFSDSEWDIFIKYSNDLKKYLELL